MKPSMKPSAQYRSPATRRYRWSVSAGSLLLMFMVATASASHIAGEPHAPLTPEVKSPVDSQYDLKKQQIARAYAQLEKKVSRVWGAETLLPDARREVMYRDNLRQRSIVDYEAGLVQVELALQDEDEDAVVARLEHAIEQTILQGADDRPLAEIAAAPETPDTQAPPLLAGMLANADGQPFSPEELADFKRAHARNLRSRSLTGADGQRRTVYSTQFSMVPEHLRLRAARVSDSVAHYARKHDIAAPLIYAIIETESAFNPRARSPIPAFGLMQLVPERAARDAFKFLYDEDRLVTERYLYVPDKNVELGTAYLHMLYFHYFKAIRDPRARQWAIIAAYNAGPRNVIKSLVGRYSRKKYASVYSWKQHAFNKINRMTAKQAYAYLRKHMPAGETRRYLKKVRARMEKYRV